MKQELKLTCDDFISVNHYMGYRAVGRRVMAYKPKETKAFEQKFGNYVKQEIINQNWTIPEKGKFIIMDTIFYFPRTDMDAQNYFKSICDIMTNVGVWEDDNIVCDKNDNSCVVISHTGKILCTFKSALALKNIYGNNYLLNVAELYNDKILYYNPKADELTDLTEDSNYIIHVSSKTEVEVTSMIGGKYTYNFKYRILINDFTGKEEKAFRLWRSI